MKTIFHTLIISFLFVNTITAQYRISGVITDESGSPLPGVTIIEKTTTNGTISDLDGKFELTVNDSSSIISLSYLGYLSEEIPGIHLNTNHISLQPDMNTLEEVVTSGYSSQKTVSLTGNICPVSTRRRIKKKKNAVSHRTPSGNTYIPYQKASNIMNNESYVHKEENNFKSTAGSPLSTFSVDVDRASYSNVRRFLNNGQKPPKDAIRIEEMINYFSYDYPQPHNEHPIAIYNEVSPCPWNNQHLLMQIGMQAKELSKEELPFSNFVFLIDVSGSMNSINKLQLVKQSLKMLVEKLREEDKVAIVVYAGAAGLVLPSTKGKNKEKILKAIDQLNAGGSTAGGQGIQLAYSVAEKHFLKNGNNRVILATDGDFNVGASSDKEMENLIIEKRKSGIYLTCLGYGMGNYKDSKLEILANKGNGNYAYIDNILEAEKTLIEEFGGTLFTIAKDVKIQIEFNPASVKAYRLVGYENRLLDAEDFKDDTKDAGEVGAGHSVTALYEIIPAGSESKYLKDIDRLRYKTTDETVSQELANIKIRYKKPSIKTSIPFEEVVKKSSVTQTPSENFRFASSVAMFGMLLSGSKFIEEADYNNVLELAEKSRAFDNDGYRAEFIRLVKSSRNF